MSWLSNRKLRPGEKPGRRNTRRPTWRRPNRWRRNLTSPNDESATKVLELALAAQKRAGEEKAKEWYTIAYGRGNHPKIIQGREKAVVALIKDAPLTRREQVNIKRFLDKDLVAYGEELRIAGWSPAPMARLEPDRIIVRVEHIS